MQSLDEIQRVHDILVGFLMGEVPGVNIDPVSRQGMVAALDALCWVLDHDHGREASFATNLAQMERLMAERGGTIERVQ